MSSSKEEDGANSLDDLNGDKNVPCVVDAQNMMMINSKSHPVSENLNTSKVEEVIILDSESDGEESMSRSDDQDIIMLGSDGEVEEPVSDKPHQSDQQDPTDSVPNSEGKDEDCEPKHDQEDSHDVIVFNSESDQDPESEFEDSLGEVEEVEEEEEESVDDSYDEESDQEEETVKEDTNGQENSNDEDSVVKEIRKRREMSENKPNAEVDTTMALDVKFSPTKLEIALSFNDALKLYTLVEGVLTLTHTARISKPLAAIAYSSSGEHIYGVRSKILSTFVKEDDKMVVERIKLFNHKVNHIHIGETCAVVGSEEGTIYVFDPDTRELTFSVKVNDDAIDSIGIFDDNAYITSANAVFAISLSKGTVDHQNEFPVDLMYGIVQGRSFVTASAKGELVLFSLPKLSLQGTFRVARESSISSLVSVNDSHMAVAFDNSSIRLYSIFPNTEVGIIGQLLTFATHMSVSFDGKWLLASDVMHNCKLFLLADVEDAPPDNKKRKGSKSSKNLTCSTSEDKEVFFSSL